MKWYGDQYMQKLSAQLRANALRAVEMLADKAKDRVDTPYPPASKPGESPHRRTGNLQRRIQATQGDASDIDEELAAYVKEDAVSSKGFPYGAFHEMNGRPYLAPTLDESHDAIVEIMAQSDIVDSQFGGME